MRVLGSSSARALKLAFTAVVLAALVHAVGWRAIWASLSAARFDWLLGMYAIVCVNFVLAAAALRLILTKSGMRVSLGRVVVSNALANAYSLLLPGDIAAGVSKWWILSNATGERARVFVGIVLNKLVLGIPPLVFGAAALAWEDPLPGVPLARWAVLAIAIGLSAGIALLHPRTGAVAMAWVRRGVAPLPAGVRDAFDKLADAVALVRGFRPIDHLQILALASLITALGVVSLGCAVQALGASVPVSTLMWIPLGLYFSRLLPITVGNLGLREGVMIVSLGIHGVEAAVAVGVGLALFSHAILLGLIGGACQLAVGLGWISLARPAAPGAPDGEAVVEGR